MPEPAHSISPWDSVVQRRSIRKFHSEDVPEEHVLAILEGASRAPSGQNMQPWSVHYVTGQMRSRVSAEVKAAVEREERSDEYAYFPERIREPYRSRRRKVASDLYQIYGIEWGDLAGRKRALLRNFDFFGAPVGLFFVMEREWSHGAWLDLGMYMMNVMTLAPSFGLATCPQQAWCEYGAAVRRVLPISQDHVIVSGMALGRADVDAAENRLRTERVPASGFVTRWK